MKTSLIIGFLLCRIVGYGQIDGRRATASVMTGAMRVPDAVLVGQALAEWVKEVRGHCGNKVICYVIVQSESEPTESGPRELDDNPYDRWARQYSSRMQRFRRPRLEILITPTGSRIRSFAKEKVEISYVPENAAAGGSFAAILRSVEYVRVLSPADKTENGTAVLFLRADDQTAMAEYVKGLRVLGVEGNVAANIREDVCFGSRTEYPRANPFAGDVTNCPMGSQSLVAGIFCRTESGKIVCGRDR